MKSQTTIFAGPSLTPAIIELIDERGFNLFPPIRRGDLTRMLDEGFNGRIIIADGVFQQVLSVGHHEIMKMMDSGCQVYGVSSMGAIRAFELRNYGMLGCGKVYSLFFEFEDFMDDEVALLFEPTSPYRIISEPLVHFRECIHYLVKEGKILQGQGQQIIEKLKELYFGDRTLHAFQKLVTEHAGIQLNYRANEFDAFRCKSWDLLNCVSEMVTLNVKKD